MKSKLSFLILAMMLPQVLFASTENLKSLVDEYTYSMTVEWDQKNVDFANAKKAEFVAGLNQLVQNGLTKEEVIEASGVNLVEIKNEIEALNLTKAEDIAQFLMNRREFKKGANWVGDAILATVFFTPIIVMIGFMIYSSATRGERLAKIDACMAANPTNNDFCFDI